MQSISSMGLPYIYNNLDALNANKFNYASESFLSGSKFCICNAFPRSAIYFGPYQNYT